MAWKLIDMEKLNASIAFVDKQHYKAGLTKELGNHQIPMFMFDAAIPDCATNGDVLCKLFPKARIYKSEIFVQFWYSEMEDGRYMNFRTNWWNAPYGKDVVE